jgi:hypothetical protein
VFRGGEEKMICDSCHTPVADDALFCPQCGKTLTKDKQDATLVAAMQDKLVNATFQNTQLQKEVKGKRAGLAVFIILTVMSFIAAAIFGFIAFKNTGLMKEYRSELSSAQSEASSYRTDALNYKSQLDKVLQDDVVVRVDSIFNSDGYGGRTDGPFYVSTLQYLSFDYEIFLSEDVPSSTIDLQVRVYGPDGLMLQGTGSTSEYTFINTATTGEVNFGGWGNDDAGTFTEGLYAIEFVYNGVVVGTTSAVVW